jgi:hypothetical protein
VDPEPLSERIRLRRVVDKDRHRNGAWEWPGGTASRGPVPLSACPVRCATFGRDLNQRLNPEEARKINDVELPEPRRWPQPITADQHRVLTPEKLELIEGYVVDGPEDNSARLKLLSLLLTNCGLEEAVLLASPEDWRSSLERSYLLDW